MILPASKKTGPASKVLAYRTRYSYRKARVAAMPHLKRQSVEHFVRRKRPVSISFQCRDSFYKQQILTGRLNRPIIEKWWNFSDRSMSCLEVTFQTRSSGARTATDKCRAHGSPRRRDSPRPRTPPAACRLYAFAPFSKLPQNH